MRNQFACVLVLAASSFFVGGCKSEKDATNKPVVSSMKDLRSDMAEFRVSIDKTQAALTELSSAADIQAAYDKLNKAVAELNSSSTEIREQAAEMKKQSEVYIAKWRDELDQVSDPSIKASAAQRRDALAANFGKIRETASGARSAYSTYNASLNAVQTTLKNDLTHGGVNMLGGKIATTKVEGDALKTELDKLTDELDAIRAGMATTRPAAPTASAN
jgi:chromosome segregation ATPase